MLCEVNCGHNMGAKDDLCNAKVEKIIALKQAGHETKDISKLVGLDESQVRRWLAR